MRTSYAFLIILSVFFIDSAFAQKKDKDKTESSLTYVSQTAKLDKTYNKEELDALGKLELTKIYMERIAIITELAPYLALHTKPGASLQEMGIPETPQNKDHLEKEVKNKVAYLESVKTTLDDIIPYADKQNIVWAILFFEEMIKQIEVGQK